MTYYFVSGLLWSLVIVLFVFRRAGKERSVLYSSIAIASALTMSIDDLYVMVDNWFGGHDYIHLASCLLLMVGVFYFARGVTRVGLIDSPGINLALGPTALIMACFAASVGFFLTDRFEDRPSTTFMATYGDQVGAATYSIAQYAYLGVVLAAMAVTATRQWHSAGNRRERWLALLLMVGSWVGVAFSLSVIWMDVTHVAGWDEALAIGQVAYHPLQMLTFLFLVAGLVTSPCARAVREHQRNQTMRTQLDRIELLWRNATDARPSIAQAMGRHNANIEERLHRRIVEIRDAELDNTNTFQLTERDLDMLAEVEDQLIAGTA